jgi:tetratricopeptide (TPR) repeat protein
MRELNQDVKEGKPPADLVERARNLESLFPEYVEAGNAYELAGDALLKAGDKAGAMAEYAKYSKVGGRDLETMEKYADLLSGSGDKKAAVAALWRMIYCFPLDSGLHEKLGNLDLATGANTDAVREFQVLVELEPNDKAGSHYNLAKAYKANGQTDKAREEAITALEAAPEYRPAQKLLLEVSGEDGKTP